MVNKEYIVDEIKKLISDVKRELIAKIEVEVERLDEKIENMRKDLVEKIEDTRKNLSERIAWNELQIANMYAMLSTFGSFQPTMRKRIKDLSRRAIPDVSGINSTRFKWSSRSLL